MAVFVGANFAENSLKTVEPVAVTPTSHYSYTSMPCKLLFDAVGYLAVSPAVYARGNTTAVPGTDVKAAQPPPRYWLCASSTASLRLLEDGGRLWISITASGIEYVHAGLLHQGRHGTVERAEHQPRILTPQHTCSCWCLTSISPQVRYWYLLQGCRGLWKATCGQPSSRDSHSQRYGCCSCKCGYAGVLVL